jgi:hypothetical protein
MSGFKRADYEQVAQYLRCGNEPVATVAWTNLSIILAALDIAAADPAPRTAEPEGDGDRTVYPVLERAARAGEDVASLRVRVTELEKLVNATALCVLRTAPWGYQRSDLDEHRNAWLKTRAEEF